MTFTECSVIDVVSLGIAAIMVSLGFFVPWWESDKDRLSVNLWTWTHKQGHETVAVSWDDKCSFDLGNGPCQRLWILRAVVCAAMLLLVAGLAYTIWSFATLANNWMRRARLMCRTVLDLAIFAASAAAAGLALEVGKDWGFREYGLGVTLCACAAVCAFISMSLSIALCIIVHYNIQDCPGEMSIKRSQSNFSLKPLDSGRSFDNFPDVLAPPAGTPVPPRDDAKGVANTTAAHHDQAANASTNAKQRASFRSVQSGVGGDHTGDSGDWDAEAGAANARRSSRRSRSSAPQAVAPPSYTINYEAPREALPPATQVPRQASPRQGRRADHGWKSWAAQPEPGDGGDTRSPRAAPGGHPDAQQRSPRAPPPGGLVPPGGAQPRSPRPGAPGYTSSGYSQPSGYGAQLGVQSTGMNMQNEAGGTSLTTNVGGMGSPRGGPPPDRHHQGPAAGRLSLTSRSASPRMGHAQGGGGYNSPRNHNPATAAVPMPRVSQLVSPRAADAQGTRASASRGGPWSDWSGLQGKNGALEGKPPPETVGRKAPRHSIDELYRNVDMDRE